MCWHHALAKPQSGILLYFASRLMSFRMAGCRLVIIQLLTASGRVPQVSTVDSQKLGNVVRKWFQVELLLSQSIKAPVYYIWSGDIWTPNWSFSSNSEPTVYRCSIKYFLWYREWKRHNTLQRMDDCHHFNDKKIYATTSRDGWLQLDWLNK